jgi:hypothetical protein
MQVKETHLDIELRVLDSRDGSVDRIGGRHKSENVIATQFAPASNEGGVQIASACLSDAIVADVVQIRETLGLKDSVRLLILEPFSPAVGEKLSAAGLAGERWALLGSAYASACASRVGSAYDHLIIGDWLSCMRDQQELSSLCEVGRFDIVVVLELSRILPRDEIPAALQWVAASLLLPYGYLVSGEPLAATRGVDLETSLLHADLLLAADQRRIEADWSWSLTRWQLRPGDSSRLTGKLREITLDDLERQVSLRQALVTCYRETFGGDEWREWMRCIACGRHFSRGEYESLLPPDQCVCGAEQSLSLFYSTQDVLAEILLHLRDAPNSRLYVRMGPPNRIEAFAWGSVARPKRVVSRLLPHVDEVEQGRLQEALTEAQHRIGIEDPAEPILHLAYVGALEHVRSLSLLRSLFARMCQFALDRGAKVIVAETITPIPAYTLLAGLGMETVFAYPHLPLNAQSSRLDESGVILLGSTCSLLAQVSHISERRLALHLARSIEPQYTSVAGHRRPGP